MRVEGPQAAQCCCFICSPSSKLTPPPPNTLCTPLLSRDHSKLAATAPGSATGAYGNVTCVGDMNRMTSQWARGGGTVCALDNEPLHSAMLASMTSVDSC